MSDNPPMRISSFEILMAAALVALAAFFVVPRLLAGAPEVRESQAAALALELDRVYGQWRGAGGVHGEGEPMAGQTADAAGRDTTELTKNLLKCFLSPVNAPYASAPLGGAGSRNLGYSGVYENPSFFPSPSVCRLTSFSKAPLDHPTVGALPGSQKRMGVLLAGVFGVNFDGKRWDVWAVR